MIFRVSSLQTKFLGKRTTNSGTRLLTINRFVTHPLSFTSSHNNLFVAEDILNVRLQTLGVKEHSFDISLSGTRVNWLLYDVGGAVRISQSTFSFEKYILCSYDLTTAWPGKQTRAF